jgi:4'-phosphopantetheinyl transferase
MKGAETSPQIQSTACLNPPQWEAPPAKVIATTDEVHIWRIALQEELAPKLRSVLSPDECARADCFHFSRDRNRFIVARGSLRTILGIYLKQNPDRVSFSYSQFGKPSLVDDPDAHELGFNLSHTNELALLAVTRGRALGVDIEFLRPEFASAEIAERFFSPHEVAALRALPWETQRAAFFNCWTRKEAYIKAIGEGLSMPLNQFHVSLAPGSAAALLGNLRDAAEVSRWSLQELDPGSGYVAAVAVEGSGWKLRCWEWRPAGASFHAEGVDQLSPG